MSTDHNNNTVEISSEICFDSLSWQVPLIDEIYAAMKKEESIKQTKKKNQWPESNKTIKTIIDGN